MFAASTQKPNVAFRNGYSSRDLAWSVLCHLDLKRKFGKKTLVCLFNSETAFKDDV